MQNRYSKNRVTTILIVFVVLINLCFVVGIAGNIGAADAPVPLGRSRDVPNNNNFDNAEPISPGSHQGSVDVTTDPFDVYKIHANGSAAVADVMNISLEANVIGLVGIVILFNPDYVEITWSVISNTQNCTIYEVAITTGTHYIMVASFFGTINYWLNLSVTQVANPLHDGDNDFGNATTANPNDSLTHNLNETYDYHDVFKLYAPLDMNITITADPSEDLGLKIYLYDAPNSSSSHLISEDSDFTDDPVAVYNDTTIQEGWYYIYVLCQGWAGPKSMDGSYIINFTIRPPNTPPGIDLADPKMALWNSAEGLIFNEDRPKQYAVDLTKHFTDDLKPFPPGGLDFRYEGDESNVSVHIHLNNTVSFTPADNWFGGPEAFTFYANDTVFECSDTINVTVQPVNDPPELRLTTTWVISNGTIKSNTEVKVEQGQKLSLVPKVFDNDTANPIAPDTLYWNVTFYYAGSTNLTGLPENFTFDETTGVINYQPSNDDIGQFTITVKVRDREDPADIDVETDARNIAFTVSNRNDNPILVSLITKTSEYFINATDFTLPELADEDSTFDFTANATDPDYSTPRGDVLMFSASNRFSLWPAVDLNKVKITVLPTNNDAIKGYIEGQITVQDDDKLEDFVRLTIPVNNTNDPPTIIYVGSNAVLASKLVHFIGAESARVGQYLNFTIKGQDIDPDDILTYDTENTSMTYGIDPEITIIQDPANKSALVAFKPSVLRGESTIILNFTVEDDGEPAYSDWVNVMIDIREVVIIEKKYTLTSSDCDKSYWDPENDVITYERKTDDKISASKGGEKGIDIVSLESRKFNDDLVITVKSTQYLDQLGMLTDLHVYVVKSTFRENGTHLKPENMDKANWELIPFAPLDEELYSGLLLDKFSAYDYGGMFADYESEIDGMTWTITMPLEDFENTFGVSHSTGFELFAVSYDGSELMYQEGDLTNLFGPKSYDSAGYYSATAPDIGQQPPGGGDGDTATSDAEEVLLYALIIIIIIAVVFIVIVAVLVDRKKKSKEGAAEFGRAAAPLTAPTEIACPHCGWMIRPDERVCPSCGAAAPTPAPVGQPCMYCSTMMPQGALKCPGCGSTAPGAPQIAAAPAQPTAAPPPQQYQQYQAPAPQPTLPAGYLPAGQPPAQAAAPTPPAVMVHEPLPTPPVTPRIKPKSTPEIRVVVPEGEEEEKLALHTEEVQEFKPEAEAASDDLPKSPYEGAAIKELEDSDEPIIMDREAEELDEE